MERLELKRLAKLVKKAAEFLNIGAEKQPVIRDTMQASMYNYQGTIRTPADTAVLRVNTQPWP